MNSVKLKSQTAKATRYVDITTDFWNTLYFQPPISLKRLIGIFERAVSVGSWAIVMSNVAFMAGSSKHGKAFRASAGENWVAATCLKWNERKSKSNAFHAKCLRNVKNNIWLSWTNIIDLTILLSYSFQNVMNRKQKDYSPCLQLIFLNTSTSNRIQTAYSDSGICSLIFDVAINYSIS